MFRDREVDGGRGRVCDTDPFRDDDAEERREEVEEEEMVGGFGVSKVSQGSRSGIEIGIARYEIAKAPWPPVHLFPGNSGCSSLFQPNHPRCSSPVAKVQASSGG